MNKELTPLQALDSIIETFINKDSEDIKTVRTALKALEIIKNKRVDVDYLIICIEQDITPLYFYNEYMKENNGIELTEEEYEFLKEVLK